MYGLAPPWSFATVLLSCFFLSPCSELLGGCFDTDCMKPWGMLPGSRELRIILSDKIPQRPAQKVAEEVQGC